MSLDLFGEPVIDKTMPLIVGGKRKPTRPSGYAAPPGSGPEGETCHTCQHYARVGRYAKPYLKCMLVKARWTNGPGTDILARSPACSYWMKAHE